MAPSHTVLHVNVAEEQAAYRAAVAEILRNVQCDTGVTLLEISEAIDVSLGTVSNAANKKADLSSVFLNRLGKVFGAHFLDPFIRLAGGRIIPVNMTVANDIATATGTIDAMVALIRALRDHPLNHQETLRIAAMLRPWLPGLNAIVHQGDELKGVA